MTDASAAACALVPARRCSPWATKALPSPPRPKSRKKRLSARRKPRMVAPWVPSKKYKSGGALQHCPHHHAGRGSEDDTWIRFFTIFSLEKTIKFPGNTHFLPCKPQTCRAFLCTRRRACSYGAFFVLAFNVIAALIGISAGLVVSLRLRLKLPISPRSHFALALIWESTNRELEVDLIYDALVCLFIRIYRYTFYEVLEEYLHHNIDKALKVKLLFLSHIKPFIIPINT